MGRSSDLEMGLLSNVGTAGIDTDTAAFISASPHPSVSSSSRPFHASKRSVP